MQNWDLDSISKLVQICFWLIGGTVAAVTGTIAVLTYQRARKTILQPLRTELFKIQLNELKTLLSLFVGKGEMDLRNDFGFQDMFEANFVKLLDEYANCQFNIKVNGKRPYDREFCPANMIDPNELVELCDGHIDEGRAPKRLPWPKAHMKELALSKQYCESKKELLKLLENPVLPTRLAVLIEDYSKAISKNAKAMMDVVHDAADELPEKYPTIESLKQATFFWLNNRLLDRFEDLKPKADAIIAFVRHEYDIDGLMKE